MTSEVMEFVRDCLADYPIKGKVLELGSMDVNGSVRDLFADRERFPTYVGVDMQKGKGVDVVAMANDLPQGDRSVSVVVTTEMLEHDPRPWETIMETSRVLAAGGWFIVTTRNFMFPRHDYPSDLWRFSPEGLEELFSFGGFVTTKTVVGHDRGTFGLAVQG